MMIEIAEYVGVVPPLVKAANEDLKSSKVVNMVLLGAACKTGVIERDELKAAVKLLVKPDFYELNCKAIDYCN